MLWIAVRLLAQPPPDFQVDVNLVRIPAVVRDANGAPVRGLRREEFIVREDGIQQEVKYAWQESDLALTVGLIADVSGSEYKFVVQHRQTVLQFLSHILSQNDRAFLVSVEQQQRLLGDSTHSIESLYDATERLGTQEAEILGDPCLGHRQWALMYNLGCGGTALWNGVFFSAKLKLRSQSGRKAMLLLTDGWDTGSDHGLADAIEASQSADAIVYAIRYVDPEWQTMPKSWAVNSVMHDLERGKRNLDRITRETGGLAFEGASDTLPEVFDRIEADLRSQYVLAYTVPKPARGRRHRKIEVQVTRPGLKVRAREGYYIR